MGNILKKYRLLHMAKESILRYKSLKNNTTKNSYHFTCSMRNNYLSNKVKQDILQLFERGNSRLYPGKKRLHKKKKGKEIKETFVRH